MGVMRWDDNWTAKFFKGYINNIQGRYAQQSQSQQRQQQSQMIGLAQRSQDT